VSVRRVCGKALRKVVSNNTSINRNLLIYILMHKHQWTEVNWNARLAYVKKRYIYDILKYTTVPYEDKVYFLEQCILAMQIDVVDYYIYEANIGFARCDTSKKITFLCIFCVFFIGEESVMHVISRSRYLLRHAVFQ
jgi:hypothetical protein